MTEGVLDWLPIEVVTGAPVRALLDDVVGAWSADWFPRRRVSVAEHTAVQGERGENTPQPMWRIYRSLIALRCSDAGSHRLVGAALDARPDDAPATDHDRLIVQSMLDSILIDLANKLEAALRLESEASNGLRFEARPFANSGGAMITLADDQGFKLLTVALPLRAVLPYARSQMPAPIRQHEKPSRMTQALAPTTLEVGAWLGRAAITLEDLKGMSVGDVLVLDTRLDEPARLCALGSDLPLAFGRLGSADDRLSLTLQA